MNIPLINFKNVEVDPKDLYKYIKMNTMICFENERRKNFSLSKDQICHNIGVKSSLFDRIQNDLALSHSPYRYDVSAKGKNNTQIMLALRIKVSGILVLLVLRTLV